MRKFWIAAGALFAAGIACLICVFPVKAAMLRAFPDGGLYLLQTDSYLAVPASEKKFLFEMTVFEVKKGDYTPLVNYEEIALVDRQGREWPAASVNLVPQFADFSLNRTSVGISVALPEDGEEELIAFDRVRFIRSEDSLTLPLGSLNVEIVADERISTQAATYEQTESSAEFSLYRVSLYNLSKESELFLRGVRLMLAEATCEQSMEIGSLGQSGRPEDLSLPAMHQGILTVNFSSERKFCHNIIRPLIAFEIEGEERCAVASNYARYVSSMDRSDILAYLNGEKR